jgi:hypothetical protein
LGFDLLTTGGHSLSVAAIKRDDTLRALTSQNRER